jgi:rod shape-determining protein MreC
MRRRRMRRNNYAPKQGVKGGLFLFALFFASFVLLVLSRLENDVVRDARGHIADWAAPVLEWASLPAVYARRGWERASAYIALYDDLDRLRQENERLRQWEWRAQRMERRLSHMRALLNAVDEQALDHATGRVIADARGPFVRSMLVNVGREQGVKGGYAVINGDGLVGRTVHVGANASRVILLNDLNSRIPVLVGPSAVRAVLAGDNTSAPRLEFLPDSAEVFEDDEVYTSGHAGLLPRGLRIGVVSENKTGDYRVRTYATLSELEFVSILFFDSPLVMATDTQAAPQTETAGSKGGETETGRSAAIAGGAVRQARANDNARPQQR